MTSENHRVDNSYLRSLYLGSFCFCTSVFSLLLKWISSEANSLFIHCELTLETCIFQCFWYFWKFKSLGLFQSCLLLNKETKFLHGRIWRRHFQQSSRLKNIVFAYNEKKKQATGMNNITRFLSTFIRLSGPTPEVERSVSISVRENLIAYWQESEQKEV